MKVLHRRAACTRERSRNGPHLLVARLELPAQAVELGILRLDVGEPRDVCLALCRKPRDAILVVLQQV